MAKKDPIKRNKEEADSNEQLASAIDKVIKKSKERDIQAEKSATTWKALQKNSAEVAIEFAIGDAADDLTDITLKKTDKIFKTSLGGFKKTVGKLFLPSTIEDGLNGVTKIIGSFRESIPIKTAVDDLEFYSLDAWNDFYSKIKEARKEDIKGLSGDKLAAKQTEFALFDELMASELDRYNQLSVVRKKHDEALKSEYTSLSGWLKMITATKKSPAQVMIENIEEVNGINSSKDIERKFILDKNNFKHNPFSNKEKTKTKQQKSTAKKSNSESNNEIQAEEAINKQLEQIETDKFKFRVDIENKLLNLMDDGFVKRHAAILLNYEKEEQAAEDYKKQKLKDQEVVAKGIYTNNNGSDQGFDIKTFDQGLLPEFLQTTNIEAQYEQYLTVAKQTQKKAAEDLAKEDEKRLQTLLAQYQSYQQQKIVINEKYDNLLNEAAYAGEEVKNNIQAARKKDLDALAVKEAETITGTTDLFKRLYAGAADKSIAEIRKVVKESKKIQAYLEKPEEFEANRAGIAKELGIEEEDLKKLEQTPGIVDKIKKATDDFTKSLKKDSVSQFVDGIKKGFALLEKGGLDNIGQGLSIMSSSITAFTPQIEKLASDLSFLFTDSQNQDIKNTLTFVTGVAEAGVGVGKILAGDFSGIFDVASGASKIFSNASKVNKEHREALKLLAAQGKAIKHNYELSQLKKDLNYEKGTTIFGSDAYGKASNAANNYQKSLERARQSTEALNDIDIVTGSKKSGWGPWKKRKDVNSDILSIYPELRKENGLIDTELAKTILSQTKMSDESKVAIQSMIDNAEQVEAAYAEMKNYLTSIFGDLGKQMTDALVDSFKNGTSAMDQFSKSAGAMLEKLVTDMVYSMTLAPIIEKAQEEMMAVQKDTSLTEEQKLAKITDITGNLIDDAIKEKGNADKILGSAQEIAKAKGIDIFTKEAPTAPTGAGIATMTQDSANELNGNFTNLLIKTSGIYDNTEQSLLVQRTMQSQLGRISENTEYCRLLENVKNSLEEMQTKGIRIKA